MYLSRPHPPTSSCLLWVEAAAALVATVWCSLLQKVSLVPLPMQTSFQHTSVSTSFSNTVVISQQGQWRRHVCGSHGRLLPLVRVTTRMTSRACGDCQTSNGVIFAPHNVGVDWHMHRTIQMGGVKVASIHFLSVNLPLFVREPSISLVSCVLKGSEVFLWSCSGGFVESSFLSRVL